MLGVADNGNPDVLSFFLLVGTAWLLIFGVIRLCRPPESRQNEYSIGMVRIASFMWPVGLVILVVSSLVWLYGVLT